MRLWDLSIEPRLVEEKPAGAPPTRELAEAVEKFESRLRVLHSEFHIA